MSDPNQPNDPGQPTSPDAGVPSGMPGGTPGQSQPVPPKKSGGAMKWVLIIVGALFLSMVCVCGGLFYAGSQAVEAGKGMLADVFHTEFVQNIERSSLPQDQQDALIAELETFRDEFKAGDITFEQMGNIITEIQNTPITAMVMAQVIEGMYIGPSGLSDDEKAEARVTVQRITRGVHEESIAQSQIDSLLAPVQTTDVNGNETLRDTISDDELRTLLADAKQLADDAGVPDEPYQPDYAKELREAIQRGKAKPTAGAGP